jgi:hypothetical protein
MEAALTLSWRDESVAFDDAELVSLSEMNFLYAADGAKIGRLLVTRATLSGREIASAAQFLANVREKLDRPLVVYDHGHGHATVCFQHRAFYELVKSSGVRYQKPTPRYVKGQKGVLASIDDVVYVKGRSVKVTAPQTLGDLPPLTSALEKLGRAVAAGLAGAEVASSPRDSYEYF